MRRIALTVALAAVAISAALGVFALVGGSFGDVHGKVLGTSLLITAAASVALAAAVALDHGRNRSLPHLGIGASVIGFGMVIVDVWAETGIDAYWKTGTSLVLVAVAAAVIALLGLGRLPRGRHWVLIGARILAVIAAVLLISAMWGELNNEVYWRAAGVVFVLLAGATVAVPVLHGMAGIPSEGVPQDIRHCPFCGGKVAGMLGVALRCPGCGRRFLVAT